MVRSALVWLGCEDPCKSMEAARTDDPVLGAMREIMSLWEHHFGLWSTFTAQKLADEVSKRQANLFGANPDAPAEFAYPELRDALLRVAGDKGRIDTGKLSYWLRGKAGRIVDGKRIEKAAVVNGGAAQWRLAKGG